MSFLDLIECNKVIVLGNLYICGKNHFNEIILEQSHLQLQCITGITHPHHLNNIILYHFELMLVTLSSQKDKLE